MSASNPPRSDPLQRMRSVLRRIRDNEGSPQRASANALPALTPPPPSNRRRAQPSERFQRLGEQRQRRLARMDGTAGDGIVELQEASERLAQSNEDLRHLLERPGSEASRLETRPPDEGERRRKRRRLASLQPERQLEKVEYGYRGQVQPGPLELEVVESDAGNMGPASQPSGNWPGLGVCGTGNILRNDKSIFNVWGRRCNIVLRHPGERMFTIDRLTVKAPRGQRGSPMLEGLVFVAMRRNATFDRTKQYQIHHYPTSRFAPQAKEKKEQQDPPEPDVLTSARTHDHAPSFQHRRRPHISNPITSDDWGPSYVFRPMSASDPEESSVTSSSSSEDSEDESAAILATSSRPSRLREELGRGTTSEDDLLTAASINRGSSYPTSDLENMLAQHDFDEILRRGDVTTQDRRRRRRDMARQRAMNRARMQQEEAAQMRTSVQEGPGGISGDTSRSRLPAILMSPPRAPPENVTTDEETAFVASLERRASSLRAQRDHLAERNARLQREFEQAGHGNRSSRETPRISPMPEDPTLNAAPRPRIINTSAYDRPDGESAMLSQSASLVFAAANRAESENRETEASATGEFPGDFELLKPSGSFIVDTSLSNTSTDGRPQGFVSIPDAAPSRSIHVRTQAPVTEAEMDLGIDPDDLLGFGPEPEPQSRVQATTNRHHSTGSTITLTFNPPISGRYILLKLWKSNSPHAASAQRREYLTRGLRRRGFSSEAVAADPTGAAISNIRPAPGAGGPPRSSARPLPSSALPFTPPPPPPPPAPPPPPPPPPPYSETRPQARARFYAPERRTTTAIATATEREPAIIPQTYPSSVVEVDYSGGSGGGDGGGPSTGGPYYGSYQAPRMRLHPDAELREELSLEDEDEGEQQQQQRAGGEGEGEGDDDNGDARGDDVAADAFGGRADGVKVRGTDVVVERVRVRGWCGVRWFPAVDVA